jgi:hypothetical protein
MKFAACMGVWFIIFFGSFFVIVYMAVYFVCFFLNSVCKCIYLMTLSNSEPLVAKGR